MEDEFSQVSPQDRNPDGEETGVEVPYDRLPAETLRELIESFVLRHGTDYGLTEISLEAKVAQVMRQLERAEARIVVDLASETCSIVPDNPLARTGR